MVESEEVIMEVADKVSVTCKNPGISYIFQASYRKANRTSGSSFTVIVDETALALVKKAGNRYKVPTISDVHANDQAAIAAK